jgi:hypothetical protein
VQLLLRDGMTYYFVACAAIGTECAENAFPVLLFTGRCLLTARCCDSTDLALSEYATKSYLLEDVLGVTIAILEQIDMFHEVYHLAVLEDLSKIYR